MKKKFMILLVIGLSLLLFVACSNATKDETALPNEKTIQREDPRTSSIFESAEVDHVRVTEEGVNVRVGAGRTFPAFATLNVGDEVNVMGKIGQWYVVLLDTNQVGCVNTQFTTPIVTDGDLEPQEPLVQQPMQDQEVVPEDQDQIAGLSSLENLMLQLINQERMKNQLPKLLADLEVSRVARIKSQDMVDNNYFSHYSPNYGSPFEMMRSFGIEYLYAGENLAGNSTVERAHNALMQSSGHRRNILNPNFTHIGLGIKPDDRYGYVFTQMFVSRPR